MLTDLLLFISNVSPSPSAKGGTGWSAALRFAPRRTAASAKAKPRPNVAFVASFAAAAPSGADTVEPPKGSLSRAPGAGPKASSSASASAATEPVASESSTADADKSSAAPDKAAVRTLAGLANSDLKLTALALPHSETDDEWLSSQLEKYPVSEPPPFTLPPQDIERDKALARKAAEARGDVRHNYDDVDAGEDEDADVNGFLSTNAGKRAARKKVSHETVPLDPDLEIAQLKLLPHPYRRSASVARLRPVDPT